MSLMLLLSTSSFVCELEVGLYYKDKPYPRCITSEGDPGKGDFEMKIHFKWLNKMDKSERFWIKDLCEGGEDEHDQILL